VEFLLTWTT